MKYSLCFELAGTPKPTNQILGHHWRIKHTNAKTWKRDVFIAVGGRKPTEPLKKAKLTLVRFNYRMLDYDGLVASFKPVVDGLTEAGVIIDDRWSVTGRWDVDQQYTPKGSSRVLVKVEEVE